MHTWREAMEHALYGPEGFYRRQAPAAHFRTSVHASRLFAEAFARLLAEVDAALGHPERLDLVDVGAGRGELLTGVLDALPGGLLARVRPLAVEVADRPAGVDFGWQRELPEEITGLVVANEWLDNVPLDVVTRTSDGPRLVCVTPDGREHPGPPPSDRDLAWLERWWPEGERAEIGRPRDEAWAEVVARLRRGVAVAVDYAHAVDERPPFGTLSGFRDGRQVAPVPDGSCDLTAHVALDSCALPGAVLTTQRAALRALGVSGTRPAPELARSDPRGYVLALSAAGEAAELTDPAGLGGFGWLVQPVEVDFGRTAARLLSTGQARTAVAGAS